MMTPSYVATASAGQPKKMSQRTFHQKASKKIGSSKCKRKYFYSCGDGVRCASPTFCKT